MLPQLRLPILGGALLVGLHLLAEYGAFAMLRFDTFTTAIIDQYRSTFNGPAAASLAGVLVLCCLVLLLFESARGAAGGTRASGPARRGRSARSDSGGRPCRPLLAPSALVVLAVGVPMLSIVRWLGIGGVAVWTDAAPRAARWSRPRRWPPVRRGPAVVLALPLAILVVRFASRTSRTLEATNYVTSSLPGIVVALALATITIRLVPPLYQTVVVLLARLRPAVPAAGAGQPAGGHRPGPGRARGGRAVARRSRRRSRSCA